MYRSAAYFRMLCLIGCLSLASGEEHVAFAGNTNLLKYAARSGNAVAWNIQVDPFCLFGNAYYSIQFQATLPTGITTSDRTLRVELYSNSYNGNDYDEHVTYYLKVPEGSSGVTESLEIPQRQHINVLFMRIYENGEKILEQRINTLNQNTGRIDMMDDVSSILVIDNDMVASSVRDTWRNRYHIAGSPLAGKNNLPDIRAFCALLPVATTLLEGSAQGDPKNDFRLDDPGLLTFSEISNGMVSYISPQELGARWLAISNSSYIFIKQADLLDLKQKQATQFEAIARWCLAGGVLIIYDAGKENSTSELDSLFNNAPANTSNIKHSWMDPSKADFSFGMPQDIFNGRNANLFYWLNLTAEEFPDDKKLPTDKYIELGPNPFGNQAVQMMPPNAAQPPPSLVRRARLKLPLPNESPFTYRRYGFGHLVAWKEAEKEAFPGKIEYWNWLLQSIQADKKMWYKRHGMSHRSENNDYWNFLIPGIGQAPVFTFMGVIGLFMVLIGPTNFHLLKRFKRISLLLVTVPLGALMFTLGLVFFAVFSDGFASQMRTRSFTRLEEGRAVAMSRQMYFAAFVPSSGLKFPSDTAIYPLHYRPWDAAVGNGSHYYQSDSERTDDGIILRSRYLGSREQRQFMVLRSTECTARLDVKEIPQADEKGKAPLPKIRVTNRLGIPLELAFVRGSKGEYYLVENLAADKSVELAPLNDAELVQTLKPGQPTTKVMQWQKQLSEDGLSFPTNFSTNQYSMLSRSNYSYRYGNRGISTPLQTESMLEQGRLQALQATQHSSMSRDGVPVLTTRQYFVIAATPLVGSDGQSLVPVGLPSAKMVRQSHIIHGNW